ERPRAEWLDLLKANGGPCGPVSDREGWVAGETGASKEMRLEFDDPKLGAVAMPGVPAKLSDTPGAVRGLAVDQRIEKLEFTPSVRPAPGNEASATAGPLAGIRVVDLGVVI